MPDKLKTLDTLHIKEKAVIVEYTDETVSQHLLEMGCLPGSEIYINNIAPLGDPIAVVVSGSTISIRKSDAAFVVVSIQN